MRAHLHLQATDGAVILDDEVDEVALQDSLVTWRRGVHWDSRHASGLSRMVMSYPVLEKEGVE